MSSAFHTPFVAISDVPTDPAQRSAASIEPSTIFELSIESPHKSPKAIVPSAISDVPTAHV